MNAIIAMGLANDLPALLGMIAGVLLLTGQAFAINRFANVNAPTWSPRLDEHQSHSQAW